MAGLCYKTYKLAWTLRSINISSLSLHFLKLSVIKTCLIIFVMECVFRYFKSYIITFVWSIVSNATLIDIVRIHTPSLKEHYIENIQCDPCLGCDIELCKRFNPYLYRIAIKRRLRAPSWNNLLNNIRTFNIDQYWIHQMIAGSRQKRFTLLFPRLISEFVASYLVKCQGGGWHPPLPAGTKYFTTL